MAGDLSRHLAELVGANEVRDFERIACETTSRKRHLRFGSLDEAFAFELACRHPWLDFDGQLYSWSFGGRRPFDGCALLAAAARALGEAVRARRQLRREEVLELGQRLARLAVDRFDEAGLTRAFAESLVAKKEKKIRLLERELEEKRKLVDDRKRRLAEHFGDK